MMGTVNGLCTLERHLHGCELRVEGPAGIVGALNARLQYLDVGSLADNKAELHFDYRRTKAAEASACRRPAGTGRAFYQPIQGEATYWPDFDTCYLQLGPGTRTVFYPERGECLTCLAPPISDVLWQAAHPLFTLPLLEMLRRRRLFFVHAASLAFGNNCLLLAGTSGSGKSTLTLALLEAGAAYMGDDLAFLDGEDASRILPLHETISATPQALNFFAGHEQWIQEPRPAGWPKYEIAPRSVGDAPFCREAIPGALIFPKVAHTRETVLSSIHPDEAFQRLATNLLLTEHRCTRAHAAALATLARATPAYQLATGTNLYEAANRLRDLIA